MSPAIAGVAGDPQATQRSPETHLSPIEQPLIKYPRISLLLAVLEGRGRGLRRTMHIGDDTDPEEVPSATKSRRSSKWGISISPLLRAS